MRLRYIILSLLPAFYLFADSLVDLFSILLERGHAVLHSPFGNAIIGISRYIPENSYYYFPPVDNPEVPLTLQGVLFALSPNFSAIIFFMMSIAFILAYAEIRKVERSYLFFAYTITLQYILFIDLIATGKYAYFFYLLTLVSNLLLIHLIRALYGRNNNVWFFLGGLLASILAVNFLYPVDGAGERLLILVLGGAHIVTFIYSAGLLLANLTAPAGPSLIQNRRIRTLLAITSLFIIGLPGFSYILPLYVPVHVTNFKNAIFYLPAIFPMFYIIFSLHYGYIYFIKPIYTWLIRIVYLLYFIFLYWLIIGLLVEYLIQSETNIFVHMGMAFLFLFVFDILRLVSNISIDHYLLYRKMVMDDHMHEIVEYVNNPLQITELLERFVEIGRLSTGAHGIKVFIANSAFEGYTIDRSYIHYISDEDPIWKLQKKQNRWLSGISRVDGGRGADLLRQHGGYHLLFFERFQIFIMVTDKTRLTPYFTEEIEYMRDMIRSTEPLIDNYRLLLHRIQMKKNDKELQVVSEIQKQLHNLQKIKSRFQVHSVVKPSRYVTADYVDIIPISPERIVMFLGDVSGHSLGSAYLMITVQSLIRGYYENGLDQLDQLFGVINKTLCSRQSMSSFMTMCAIDIEIVSDSPEKELAIRYINAGQHAPVVFRHETGGVIPFEDSQRVLGVIESENYSVSSLMVKGDIRILLSSDGAFEIFDNEGKMLGEKDFERWAGQGLDKSVVQHGNFLMEKIKGYSTEKGVGDDLSLLIVDTNQKSSRSKSSRKGTPLKPLRK